MTCSWGGGDDLQLGMETTCSWGGGDDLQQCAHVQLDWHVYAFEVQRLYSRNCKPNMIALPLRSQEVDLCSWTGGGGGGGGGRGGFLKSFSSSLSDNLMCNRRIMSEWRPTFFSNEPLQLHLDGDIEVA